MDERLFIKQNQQGKKPFPQTKIKRPLLLVLNAPPLPLNQGYRLAAYNDIIQLSSLHDLHILICNGKDWVYDFDSESYELNQKKLSAIPGVKSVSFINLNVDWKKSFLKRFLHQVSVLLQKGRIIEDNSADELTQRVIEVCRNNNINDIHFGITINLFLDTFANLHKTSAYRMSFTAHDIDADKTLIRMKENLADKKLFKVLTNFITYRALLWKEIRTCRKSRFVISMAYKDYERLALNGVNVFYIPPYIHSAAVNHSLNNLPSNPSLVVLGHLAFSAAGHGVELFLDKVATRVKAEVPGAVIKIIGKDVSQLLISKCKQLGIIYKKYVEGPEELWNETTVVASPLLVSKGIRIRILEAAYRGIPVVCTEESATGFYNPSKFLRVTSDFEMFADYCIKLLTDNALYNLEQKRIYDYFSHNLSKDTIKKRWEHVWAEDSSVYSFVPASQKLNEMITQTAGQV